MFENAFCVQNFLKNICYDDYYLWKEDFKHQVIIKAPLFVKQYNYIENLKAEEITTIRIAKYNGESETHSTDKGIANSEATTNGNSENVTTDESTATTKSSGDSKTKSSNFPYDIEKASNFESVNYMDAGAISENNGSSTTNSDGKSTSKGTTTQNSANSSSDERTGNINNYNKHTETVTGSPIEYGIKFIEIQKNIIQEFVDSFNEFFILLW